MSAPGEQRADPDRDRSGPERDILGTMEFQPGISPQWKNMDEKMFLPNWERLKETPANETGSDALEDELVAAS